MARATPSRSTDAPRDAIALLKQDHRMVEALFDEFEDAAFGLKENGQIGAPVRTRYGWHIIKRLDQQAPPTFDAAKAELKTKIARGCAAGELSRSKPSNRVPWIRSTSTRCWRS